MLNGIERAYDYGDMLLSPRLKSCLLVDYWDYDAGAWVALLELETTGASTADYQNCENQINCFCDSNVVVI